MIIWLFFSNCFIFMSQGVDDIDGLRLEFRKVDMHDKAVYSNIAVPNCIQIMSTFWIEITDARFLMTNRNTQYTQHFIKIFVLQKQICSSSKQRMATALWISRSRKICMIFTPIHSWPIKFLQIYKNIQIILNVFGVVIISWRNDSMWMTW